MRVALKLLCAVFASGCSGNDDDEPRRIGADEIVHQFQQAGVGRSQLGVTHLDGSRTEQLTNLANRVNFPAVSPDGSQVVFGQLSRLFLYDVATGTVRQLTFGPAIDHTPRWSSNGTQLVYGSAPAGMPGASDICIMAVAGGPPSCLTGPDEFDDSSPDWSPDGTQIAWQREADSLLDLWIMNADGSNQRLLLDHSDYDTLPQWSPDGRFILFRSWRFGPPSLFILELATGVVEPVLGDSLDPAFLEGGSWTPDGLSVIAEVLNPNNRLVQIDVGTGDARFITQDTLSYSGWPSMRRLP